MPNQLKSHLQILPAEAKDLHTLARIHRDAFSLLPLFQAMFGKVSIADEENRIFLQQKKVMDSASGRVYKAVIDGCQIVGMGAFDIPSTIVNLEGAGRTFPIGTNVELADSFYLAIARSDARVELPHYHYHSIAVDPSYHNRGIGAALLQVAIEMSNLDGRQLFLDATEQGVPLYLKNGFKYFGDPLVVGKNLEYKLDPMVYTPINCLEAAGL